MIHYSIGTAKGKGENVRGAGIYEFDLHDIFLFNVLFLFCSCSDLVV